MDKEHNLKRNTIDDWIKVTIEKKKGKDNIEIEADGDFHGGDWALFAVLMEGAYVVIQEFAQKHSCPDGMSCEAKMGAIQMYNALTELKASIAETNVRDNGSDN